MQKREYKDSLMRAAVAPFFRASFSKQRDRTAALNLTQLHAPHSHLTTKAHARVYDLVQHYWRTLLHWPMATASCSTQSQASPCTLRMIALRVWY